MRNDFTRFVASFTSRYQIQSCAPLSRLARAPEMEELLSRSSFPTRVFLLTITLGFSRRKKKRASSSFEHAPTSGRGQKERGAFEASLGYCDRRSSEPGDDSLTETHVAYHNEQLHKTQFVPASYCNQAQWQCHFQSHK